MLSPQDANHDTSVSTTLKNSLHKRWVITMRTMTSSYSPLSHTTTQCKHACGQMAMWHSSTTLKAFFLRLVFLVFFGSVICQIAPYALTLRRDMERQWTRKGKLSTCSPLVANLFLANLAPQIQPTTVFPNGVSILIHTHLLIGT